MKKIAVIGAGNMGSAIASSLQNHGDRIVCTAASQSTLDKIRCELSEVETTLSNVKAVENADIIVLAIKPFIAAGVIEEIKEHIKPGAVIMSVIAVLPINELRNSLGADEKRLQVIRIVPNTAIKYGKSVTFLSAADDVSTEIIADAEEIFNRSGKAFIVKEKDLPVCTALASCGIAFFLRFIRAAAEGSVELGLRASFATKIAALTAEGAAALLADGSHPEAEIDKVTTPGGITIKGLNALEENGFNHAVIAALRASCVDNA